MNRKKRQQLRRRLRRERIRQHKHQWQSQPKHVRLGLLGPFEDFDEFDDFEDFEDGIAVARRPSHFAAERTLHELHLAMDGHQFSSPAEMDAYLQSLMGGGLEKALAGKERSPAWIAQQLAYDAMEADEPPKALALARKAMEFDCGCIDALRTASALLSPSRDEFILFLGGLVELAEAQLGFEVFEENRGHFWKILCTRPYMRTRFELTLELFGSGRLEEAVPHFEALLELNPDDNQGARDYLLACYLSAGNLSGAQRLMDAYDGDASAVFLWSRVLDQYLAGDIDAASSALIEARQSNWFAEAYLTGRKKLPRTLPGYYSPGRESEAIHCAAVLGAAWRSHRGAVDWLESPLS